MEVMQTIKEILKLNPFFKEQMQMILERTEIHESGKLADFGAALTTADAQALQEVLSTLNVTRASRRRCCCSSKSGALEAADGDLEAGRGQDAPTSASVHADGAAQAHRSRDRAVLEATTSS